MNPIAIVILSISLMFGTTVAAMNLNPHNVKGELNAK